MVFRQHTDQQQNHQKVRHNPEQIHYHAVEDSCPKQNTYECGKAEKDGVETCCFCVKQPMGR